MLEPALPANEKERLHALSEYQVMDSLPEEDYDNITRLASQICGTPISLITLIDENRQWFKSRQGLTAIETPREEAFCAHGILNPDQALVVPNANEDDRFKENPLVTGEPYVEFYAGIPLVTPDGFPLGSLCVIDNKPREIAPEKIESLKILANQVVKLLELRRLVFTLKKTQKELENSVSNLEEFAYVISHDIKAPIRNMRHLAEAISEDYEDKLDAEGKKYLKRLEESANDSMDYIEGVLNYSKATHLVKINSDKIDLNKFLPKLIQYLSPPPHIKIYYREDLPSIKTSKIALQQILSNLISNAIKYNDKDKGLINIEVNSEKDFYFFKVADNGRGIPQDKLGNIFSLFYMVNKKDAKRKGSTGIGLSIVEKLVKNLGGEIKTKSIEKEGTEFIFSIKKEFFA